jgi:hypothetical protein
MKRKKEAGPPAKEMLVQIGASRSKGEKCQHAATDGYWLVEWGGKLYQFADMTQMQKDSWLSTVRYDEGEKRYEEAVKALRWFCYQCGTVQMP